MSDSARISEYINETVVISSCDQVSIVRELHTVDVRAVSARRENSVNEPSELSSVSGPFSLGVV